MKTDNFSPDGFYAGIYLFNESAARIPLDRSEVEHIASLIQDSESCRFHMVEVVFVDEGGIVAINKEYLEHDYVTDIISFRYDEDQSNDCIEGTLYCCAPRIIEQANDLEQTTEQEFKRIVIHGLLHLIGYEDKSDSARQAMRQQENFYLNQLA